jgi:hypothetical protein
MPPNSRRAYDDRRPRRSRRQHRRRVRRQRAAATAAGVVDARIDRTRRPGTRQRRLPAAGSIADASDRGVGRRRRGRRGEQDQGRNPQHCGTPHDTHTSILGARTEHARCNDWAFAEPRRAADAGERMRSTNRTRLTGNHATRPILTTLATRGCARAVGRNPADSRCRPGEASRATSNRSPVRRQTDMPEWG